MAPADPMALQTARVQPRIGGDGPASGFMLDLPEIIYDVTRCLFMHRLDVKVIFS